RPPTPSPSPAPPPAQRTVAAKPAWSPSPPASFWAWPGTGPARPCASPTAGGPTSSTAAGAPSRARSSWPTSSPPSPSPSWNEQSDDVLGVGAQAGEVGRTRAAGPGAADRDDPGGLGLVGGRRARRRAGDRLPVLARRGAGTARSALAVPAGRGARAVAGRRPRRLPVDRPAVAGGGAAVGGAHLRGPHRNVHARGHLRGGHRAAPPPRGARRHAPGAHAGGGVPGHPGLGVRRRRPVRPPPRLRRPRRAQAPRRRRPRRRPRRDHRRRPQPPRP